MSKQEVYVVRHYSYDYHTFESLIGLAATKKAAETLARDNEHVWDEPTITYSLSEHQSLGGISQERPHVYIELMEVKHD